LDCIFTFGIVPQVPHIHEMAAGWFGTISALVLLGVLGYATLEPKLTQRTVKVEKAESSVTLTIEGMTCDHCVESVRHALLACPGVRSAAVQLRTGRAAVGGDGLDIPALRRAVEGLGYTVKEPDAAV
jgi:copper chaperone CopZ